ncbi:hypothetical protein K458DRAFT_49280 [Lentithecium fluviatile CBS 122367]|uniref:RING-type domain-containing protein n=1 Tax=Lentithecium fluviatile CBS 122367 TaxID=1168545 RepID=A0A6G1IYP0_9PLEO|nr:hypothetical protein K458DRAFT_49280 [Lentithecium fluviatile CBS 122367]
MPGGYPEPGTPEGQPSHICLGSMHPYPRPPCITLPSVLHGDERFQWNMGESRRAARSIKRERVHQFTHPLHSTAPPSPANLQNYAKVSASGLPQDTECEICYEPYDGGDHSAIKLEAVGCGHLFAHKCLQHWVNSGMGNAHTCPKCRRSLDPCLDKGRPRRAPNPSESLGIAIRRPIHQMEEARRRNMEMRADPMGRYQTVGNPSGQPNLDTPPTLPRGSAPLLRTTIFASSNPHQKMFTPGRSRANMAPVLEQTAAPRLRIDAPAPPQACQPTITLYALTNGVLPSPSHRGGQGITYIGVTASDPTSTAIPFDEMDEEQRESLFRRFPGLRISWERIMRERELTQARGAFQRVREVLGSARESLKMARKLRRDVGESSFEIRDMSGNMFRGLAHEAREPALEVSNTAPLARELAPQGVGDQDHEEDKGVDENEVHEE